MAVVTMSCLVLAAYSEGAATQDLETKKQALALIQGFAERMCPSVPMDSRSTIVEVDAAGRAQLAALVKKIADLGVKAAAKYQRAETQGLLQKDILTALRDTTNCRVKILEILSPKFFPEDSSKGRSTDNDVRQRHLARLQTVLRNDAHQLKNAAENLRSFGTLTRTVQTDEERRQAMQSVFVTDEVLESDLPNHYASYANHKQKLIQSAMIHEAEYSSTMTTVMEPVASKLNPQESTYFAVAVIARCMGTGRMEFSESPRSWSFAIPGMSQSGGGEAPPGFREMYAAYTKFIPDPAVVGHCESMKRRAREVSQRATELRRDALDLADRQVLSGSCRYLK